MSAGARRGEPSERQHGGPVGAIVIPRWVMVALALASLVVAALGAQGLLSDDPILDEGRTDLALVLLVAVSLCQGAINLLNWRLQQRRISDEEPALAQPRSRL